jgi:uncharacterized iron-regulated membrane protein
VSTQQSLYVDRRRDVRHRNRRRADRVQLAIVLSALTLAVLANLLLNHLALILTR